MNDQVTLETINLLKELKEMIIIGSTVTIDKLPSVMNDILMSKIISSITWGGCFLIIDIIIAFFIYYIYKKCKNDMDNNVMAMISVFL